MEHERRVALLDGKPTSQSQQPLHGKHIVTLHSDCVRGLRPGEEVPHADDLGRYL